ncbi:FAD:protein FMN transferase [Persicitalea jodogahamensis]|uniref:FAD:protein FMN transferase n=1 Tax=Persicitalea jodogahamensis TaxID=402147 RepID=A0A8J3D3U8_9BACT|nr:FAD:protein FMN transferase [Persicitalea jodogahamensis]GHB70337.1 FAD:protein FMN transferase [Persicitalea jodogahamensis]
MMRHLSFVVLVLFLASCQSPRPSYTQLEGNAQGTTFRIVYADSLSRDFSVSVDSIFHVIDRSMSLWDSTSVISLINANRSGIRADTHFTNVFRRAWEVSGQTDGNFDCTVGPLVKAWGFSYKKKGPPPNDAQVDSLLRLAGYRRVSLEGRVVNKPPETEIDFNAIAQGYTVDVLAEFLHSKSIHNYLIEVGGEVRTMGRNERGKTWRIGIDKPMENVEAGRPLQAVVSLKNKSLATSGSYRKFVERGGQRFSHAIDPRTGFPITHNLLSISVVADDCMTADAYATAFLVMGLEKAIPLAKEKGLEIYGISAGKDNTFEVYQSAGFGAEAVE